MNGFVFDKCSTLNHDQEDFGNVQNSDRRDQVRVALCSSVWCAPRNKNGKLIDTYRMSEKKGVSPTASVCPDCNNVLFWEQRKVKRK